MIIFSVIRNIIILTILGVAILFVRKQVAPESGGRIITTIRSRGPHSTGSTTPLPTVQGSDTGSNTNTQSGVTIHTGVSRFTFRPVAILVGPVRLPGAPTQSPRVADQPQYHPDYQTQYQAHYPSQGHEPQTQYQGQPQYQQPQVTYHRGLTQQDINDANRIFASISVQDEQTVQNAQYNNYNNAPQYSYNSPYDNNPNYPYSY